MKTGFKMTMVICIMLALVAGSLFLRKQIGERTEETQAQIDIHSSQTETLSDISAQEVEPISETGEKTEIAEKPETNKEFETEEQSGYDEEAYLAELSKTLPYVGMSEYYLSDTILGTAYYYGANKSRDDKGNLVRADIYYYYIEDYIIYVARTNSGRVIGVTDYLDDPRLVSQLYKMHPYIDHQVQGNKRWEGAPNPTFEKLNGSLATKASPEAADKRSDPYDVYDYDDPDDFADEWALEFDDDFDGGYDEAYDYWEEHH